jgi:stress response protein SCP2/predicted type IV restriction endonuclease
MEIKRGQRLPLVDFLPNNLSFQIELSILGVPVDFTCFGLNADGKLLHDEYMTFFNQSQTPCSGISVSFTTHSATFLCDLNKLPSTIESLSFTAAIDGVGTMNQMKSGYLKFLSNDREVGCFKLNSTDFNSEKSLMLGDIYRKNGAWRFNAVGQGFNGGLELLATHFGVDINDKSSQNCAEKIKRRTRSVILAEYVTGLHQKIIKFLPKVAAAVENSANESNTRMILDRFFIDVLDYDIDEVKAEQKIQGRRADYVLAADRNDLIVVEAKKAGMTLSDKQIFQATSYGAYSGIRWALLTNLVEWQLYRVSTIEKVEANLVFSIKLSSTISLQDVERLALISRTFVNHKNIELEKLWRECNALSNESIGGILLTDDIISKVRSIVKRDTDCNVTNEQVRNVIEQLLNLN